MLEGIKIGMDKLFKTEKESDCFGFGILAGMFVLVCVWIGFNFFYPIPPCPECSETVIERDVCPKYQQDLKECYSKLRDCDFNYYTSEYELTNCRGKFLVCEKKLVDCRYMDSQGLLQCKKELNELAELCNEESR